MQLVFDMSPKKRAVSTYDTAPFYYAPILVPLSLIS